MMKITVIGSLSQAEIMKEISQWLEMQGNLVRTPADDNIQENALLNIQSLWIENIRKCDMIVAIPKSCEVDPEAEKTVLGYTFGESTSYELAIAMSMNKPIMVWSKIEREGLK